MNEEIQCVLCTWIVDWDLYPLHWLGLVMILFINMFFGCFTYVLFSKVDYVSDGEEYFKRSVIILHCALNITLCTQWVISKYWCTVQSLQNGARHRGTISLHQITFLSQYNIFVFATTEYCQSSVRCHVEWIGCVIQFSWYKSGIKESICLLGHVKSFAPWGYKRIRSGRRRLHSNSPCRKATGNEWSRPRAALWNLWDVMLQ